MAGGYLIPTTCQHPRQTIGLMNGDDNASPPDDGSRVTWTTFLSCDARFNLYSYRGSCGAAFGIPN